MCPYQKPGPKIIPWRPMTRTSIAHLAPSGSCSGTQKVGHQGLELLSLVSFWSFQLI